MSRLRCMLVLMALGIACATGAAQAPAEPALAKDLQASYSRVDSPLLVRSISSTTRAALDYLTHDRNCLFHYPALSPLQSPPPVTGLSSLTLGDVLVADSIRDRLQDTPLTPDEQAQPLSWQPVLRLLTAWDYDQVEGLLEATARVSGEKWGNPEVVQPLQRISTAYLRGPELWVKVEFRPELTWLPVSDEDGDGYRELYGRLNPTLYSQAVPDHLSGDYLSRALDLAEMQDYFFELTSEWYQAYRTVTLEPEETEVWPNAETEAEIREMMGGRTFTRPFVVIRGEPFERVIYNVFLLPESAEGEAGRISPAHTDWQGELRRFGGSWEAWEGRLAAFQDDVRRNLQARPADIRGLIGADGWLFFRGDLAYLLSGDLRRQPDNRDPYPAIVDFHEQLRARGIDMLLVVIPTKAEVYPEKLSALAPEGGEPYVAPYCRKLLGELTQAGVAVVDLLPAFLAAREGEEPLHMPHDTHWTPRAVQLAARLIAEAVRERPVHAALPAGSVAYTTREATFTRLGDIVTMLPDQEKIPYRPMRLRAQQVIAPGGAQYQDDPGSPLVMLGDSFTGVFHLEDCKHAGLSAHLARELGMPVDLIMAQGSGPRIRGQLARRGPAAISEKKLVIWTVVSRDLYAYWAPWEVIKLP